MKKVLLLLTLLNCFLLGYIIFNQFEKNIVLITASAILTYSVVTIWTKFVDIECMTISEFTILAFAVMSIECIMVIYMLLPGSEPEKEFVHRAFALTVAVVIYCLIIFIIMGETWVKIHNLAPKKQNEAVTT